MGCVCGDGSIYEVLTSYDPKQAQKLEEATEELVSGVFQRVNVGLPKERLKGFLVSSMVNYRRDSLRAKLGIALSPRRCLIKSAKDLAYFLHRNGMSLLFPSEIMEDVREHLAYLL